MNSHRWRDPFVARTAQLVQLAVREYDTKASSTAIELECRMGALSSRRTNRRMSLPFPARSPTIFGEEIKQAGSFDAGVAFQRLEKIDDRLRKCFHRRLPSTSVRSLVVSTSHITEGKQRLEYTVVPSSSPRSAFLNAVFDKKTEKHSLESFDLHFPDGAADTRFCISSERTCVPPRGALSFLQGHHALLAGESSSSGGAGGDVTGADEWSSIVAKSVRLRQRKQLTLNIPRLGGLPLFALHVTLAANVGYQQQWAGFAWSERVAVDLSTYSLSRHLQVEVEVCLPSVQSLARREGSLDAAAESVAVELLSLVRLLSDP